MPTLYLQTGRINFKCLYTPLELVGKSLVGTIHSYCNVVNYSQAICAIKNVISKALNDTTNYKQPQNVTSVSHVQAFCDKLLRESTIYHEVILLKSSLEAFSSLSNRICPILWSQSSRCHWRNLLNKLYCSTMLKPEWTGLYTTTMNRFTIDRSVWRDGKDTIPRSMSNSLRRTPI